MADNFTYFLLIKKSAPSTSNILKTVISETIPNVMGCKNKDNYTPRIKMRGPVFAPISSFSQWGTWGTLRVISGIFFLYNFLVRLSGKWGLSAPCAPNRTAHYNTPDKTSWNPPAFSNAVVRSSTFFHRMPDQKRSPWILPPSFTLRSRNASAILFPDGAR